VGIRKSPCGAFDFLPKFYNRGMDKEPSESSSTDQPEAKIIQFPNRKSELDRSIDRHPAKGKETIQQTLARLGLENSPEDPGTA
jgi:hypothetical protein